MTIFRDHGGGDVAFGVAAELSQCPLERLLNGSGHRWSGRDTGGFWSLAVRWINSAVVHRPRAG